ncbi:hypothetical protein CRI77_24365 [Mycolicibacterium duvalii]|uniref:Uncharacterized protein n=1 Tax=Mycolicibacterium duvalii TaxID=39688 RepID=A0A7I7K5I9_9MYCO|nr:DUF3566 domain-containing protein [Mycolicibacterium duvalii]MCV7365959.1 DUF3566 domain-containing protein [Mycolicibacterium duvalii]PEG35840.1 hypothetical protein CRI77_24365 [Mycolicibacterium duvalii]BBX19400.1 hypothetical protein MDUV_42600 [Mycolicibacterium duvalii]
MSSPNEPGHSRAGDGSGGGNGSPTPAKPAPESGSSGGDVPPWQRGPATRARQHQAPEPTGEGRPGTNPGGLDARLNRFMAGGAPPETEQAGRTADRAPTPAERAPDRPADRAPERAPDRPADRTPDRPADRAPDRNKDTRTETIRPEQGKRPEPGPVAYASEIPDLSGAAPRSAPAAQRKPADRPGADQPPRSPRPAPPSRAIEVASRQQHRGPVRASMQIRRVDPWSTLKVSLLLSVALFFVWMIAVAFLYLVLGGMGVWSKLNSNVGDLLTSASGSSGGELVSSGTIFGGAALIGLVNIVLLTAAATIGAFIYNLTTDLVGGVEVTLADRD